MNLKLKRILFISVSFFLFEMKCSESEKKLSLFNSVNYCNVNIIWQEHTNDIITTGSLCLLHCGEKVCFLKYYIVDKRTYAINLIHTVKSARNKGLAKIILQCAIDLFRLRGVKEIDLRPLPLDSTTNKELLIKFYSNLDLFFRVLEMIE